MVNTFLRIFLVFALVLGIAFAYLIDRLSDRVERQYFEAAEEPLVDTAHLLASAFNGSTHTLEKILTDAHAREFNAQIYSLTKSTVGIHVYITDTAGTVIYDSDNGRRIGRDYSEQRDVARTLRREYGARTSPNRDNPAMAVMTVGAPIYRDGNIAGCLSVSKPQKNLLPFIEETRRYITVAGWLTFTGLLAFVGLALYGFSRPVRRLIRYVEAVRRGGRPVLHRSRNPEAAALGDALEEMRDALEGRHYAETYAQTLTHEMKSPIAAIRGASELLEDESMPAAQRRQFLTNIQNETQRLQNSTDRLLALSAIESQRGLQRRETLFLSAMLHEICTHLTTPAADALVELTVSCPESLTVQGDSFLLEMAISNFVQNAITFSPSGGNVSLTAERNTSLKTTIITVTDEGTGIPDYAIDRVFERFYSLPQPATGRKSSGLGLCFVKETAELHGGSATLENRKNGAPGAVATITIPDS